MSKCVKCSRFINELENNQTKGEYKGYCFVCENGCRKMKEIAKRFEKIEKLRKENDS